MPRHFPKDFVFGTSTAAAQIETADSHDWQGYRARDGHVFDRTTDHEHRHAEDIDIIATLAPGYRMSVAWNRLQRAPFAPLDPSVVLEYRNLLQELRSRGVSIMMVLHHFTNPRWFSEKGGWEKRENIKLFLDFGRKVSEAFGEYVDQWNTFNEPNVYVSYGWLTGFFPPFKINPLLAIRVLKNLGLVHEQLYAVLKERHPDRPVGISHNAVVFAAQNMIGRLPASLSDWWFMDHVPSYFEKADFFGMSYYARVSHDPMPITYLDTPDKIRKYGLPHDDMWEYHPEGLRTCLDRYWKKYKKPIIITENGVCDESDTLRQRAIHEYAAIVHDAIADGIDIRGYYWWSAWDNFEWHLGPTRRFGLYACNLETKERTPRPSASTYAAMAHSRTIPDLQ